MMISSKGRYALRVMLDLAERDNGSYLRLKDIAERLGIPRRYRGTTGYFPKIS